MNSVTKHICRFTRIEVHEIIIAHLKANGRQAPPEAFVTPNVTWNWDDKGVRVDWTEAEQVEAEVGAA